MISYICLSSYHTSEINNYSSYMYRYMGENSKFPKSWTSEIQILNLQDVFNMDNLKLWWLIVFR